MAQVSSYLLQLPAIILAGEFILGGLLRASSFPFKTAHEQVLQKNIKITPILYPIVPFTDVVWHNRWVGGWMIATGTLLAHPRTRARLTTLGLVLFWTGAGAYSQAKADMPYWVPVVNAALGILVWSIENRVLDV